MTAPQQPHPLRCETCNDTYEDDLKGFTYCKKTNLVLFVRDENNKIIDRGMSVLITRVVGCASHSSAPAREQRNLTAIKAAVDELHDDIPNNNLSQEMIMGSLEDISEMCGKQQPPAPAAAALLDFVRLVETKNREMADLMRRNKIKITDTSNPMQKLAFTFYTEIGELAHKAGVLMVEHEAALRQRGEQHE